MTTLENRPNTALVVIDVQNRSWARPTSGTRWSRTSAAWWRKLAPRRFP